MSNRNSKIIRLWNIAPRFAFAFVWRKFSRKATLLLPREDWNKNWLGEEMRPYNSLHN